MIEIPIWIFLSTMFSVAAIVAGAVCWGARMKSRAACRADMVLLRGAMSDERKEIWRKIDEMYTWMLTGQIVLRRRSGG